MNLPKKIKIACFDIAVEDWNVHGANARGAYGIFSCEENIIRIDTTQPPYRVIETFMHELNHAIYWAYKIDDVDKEERVVGTFATGLTQVFRDNPEVLEFINKTLEEERRIIYNNTHRSMIWEW